MLAASCIFSHCSLLARAFASESATACTLRALSSAESSCANSRRTTPAKSSHESAFVCGGGCGASHESAIGRGGVCEAASGGIFCGMLTHSPRVASCGRTAGGNVLDSSSDSDSEPRPRARRMSSCRAASREDRCRCRIVYALTR